MLFCVTEANPQQKHSLFTILHSRLHQQFLLGSPGDRASITTALSAPCVFRKPVGEGTSLFLIVSFRETEAVVYWVQQSTDHPELQENNFKGHFMASAGQQREKEAW